MRIIFDLKCYIYEATSRLSQLLKLTQRQRSEMDFVHFTLNQQKVE